MCTASRPCMSPLSEAPSTTSSSCSAPALVPVVSDDSDEDDEAAFLKAASGALDE